MPRLSAASRGAPPESSPAARSARGLRLPRFGWPPPRRGLPPRSRRVGGRAARPCAVRLPHARLRRPTRHPDRHADRGVGSCLGSSHGFDATGYRRLLAASAQRRSPSARPPTRSTRLLSAERLQASSGSTVATDSRALYRWRYGTISGCTFAARATTYAGATLTNSAGNVHLECRPRLVVGEQPHGLSEPAEKPASERAPKRPGSSQRGSSHRGSAGHGRYERHLGRGRHRGCDLRIPVAAVGRRSVGRHHRSDGQILRAGGGGFRQERARRGRHGRRSGK